MDSVREEETATLSGCIPSHDFNIQMEIRKYIAS